MKFHTTPVRAIPSVNEIRCVLQAWRRIDRHLSTFGTCRTALVLNLYAIDDGTRLQKSVGNDRTDGGAARPMVSLVPAGPFLTGEVLRTVVKYLQSKPSPAARRCVKALN